MDKLVSLTNETFLRHRCDQSAALAVKSAGVEAPCTRRARTLLHIKNPSIGPEWAMKPHRMVETCELQLRRKQRCAMRKQRSVEKTHIRGVSKNALVQGRRIRQHPFRAHPEYLPRWMPLSREPILRNDGTNFDGALAQKPWPHFFRQFRCRFVPPLSFALERSWRRNIGHWVLMREPLFLNLKGGGHCEDEFVFLQGGNATGRKTPPIAAALDLIENRVFRISWT